VPVVERELVDGQIKAATSACDKIADPSLAHFAKVLVHCTEAVVRQLRDQDDTVAVQLIPAVEQGFGDLGLQIDGLSTTVHQSAPQKKAGLF
jgi:hypothetical protein